MITACNFMGPSLNLASLFPIMIRTSFAYHHHHRHHRWMRFLAIKYRESSWVTAPGCPELAIRSGFILGGRHLVMYQVINKIAMRKESLPLSLTD